MCVFGKRHGVRDNSADGELIAIKSMEIITLLGVQDDFMRAKFVIKAQALRARREISVQICLLAEVISPKAPEKSGFGER